MNKETVINNVKRYAREVNKILSPDAIVLYGSYANGTATEDSDIDI